MGLRCNDCLCEFEEGFICISCESENVSILNWYKCEDCGCVFHDTKNICNECGELGDLIDEPDEEYEFDNIDED